MRFLLESFPHWCTRCSALMALTFTIGGCGSDELFTVPTPPPEAEQRETTSDHLPKPNENPKPDETPLPVCPARGLPKNACISGSPSSLRLSPGYSVSADALGSQAQANDLGVGDYNGDGVRDVVVFFSQDSEGQNGIALLAGDGSGGLELTAQTSLGTWLPLRAVEADLDGRGGMDFAIIGMSDPCAAEPGANLSIKIALFASDQPGWTIADTYVLSNPYQYGVGGKLSPISLGDVDNDGDVDILAGNSLHLLMNAGDGTFKAATPNLGGTNYKFYDIAVADLNRDGFLDLATVDGDWWVMRVFHGDGSGSFAPQNDVGWGVLADSPERIITGDFNGDGNDDVRTLHESCYDVYYRNPGDAATWPEGEVYETTQDPTFREAVGDFDGDGYDDLALVGLGIQMTILVLDADGSVAQEHTLNNLANLNVATSGFLVPQIASGDLNNDCVPDLVVGARDIRTYGVNCLTESDTRPLLEILLADPCGT